MKKISNIQEEFYKIVIKILERSEKVPFFQNIVLILDTIVLMGLIVRVSFGEDSALRYEFDALSGNSILKNIVVWIFLGLLFLSIMFSILQVWSKQRFCCSTWVSSVLFAILQVIGLYCLLSMLSVVDEAPTIINIFICLTFLSFLGFAYFMQPELHLLGVITIPLVCFELILPQIIWKISFVLVLIASLRDPASKIQRFGCLTLLFSHVWSFCHSASVDNSSFKVVNLVIFILMSILLAYFWIEQQNEDHCIRLLLKTVRKENKLDKGKLNLKREEKMRILRFLQTKQLEMEEPSIKDRLTAIQESIFNQEVTKDDVLDLLVILAEERKEKWLRAQVEIIRHKNYLKMFQCLGEIRPETFVQSIKLEKMKSQAQKLMSSTYSNHQVDIKFVEQITSNLENFNKNIYCALYQCACFWGACASPEIQAKTVSKIFSKVLEHQYNAKASLSRIQASQYCRKQTLLYETVNSIINNYAGELMQDKTSKFDTIHEVRTNYDFVILSGSTIEEISTTLIIQLELENERKFLSDREQIFPEKIIRTILNMYSQNNTDFLVPLKVRGQILVKSAHIHLLPSYDEKVKYMLVLRSLSSESYFLYNFTEDNIDYFSQSLSDKLSLFNMNNLPQDFLNIHLSFQIIQQMKKGNHVSCEYSRKLREGESSKVTLNLMASYEGNNTCYYLIEMKSTASQDKNKFQNTQDTKKTSLFLDLSINKEMGPENFKQQQFFCKIKNPYSDNIVQKLENLQRINTPSISSWVLLAFLLFIVTVVAFLISSQKFSLSRTQEYMKYLRDGSDLNEEYQYIIGMFYESHIRYLIKTQPARILSYDPSLNISFLLDFYTASIKKKISAIMEIQLWNPLKPFVEQINYSFKDKLYNTSASTRSKDIVILLTEVQKYLTNYDLSFLVDNYGSMREIENAFKISSIVADSLTKLDDSPSIVSYITIAISSGLILLIYIIILKGKQLSNNIYSYLLKLESWEHKKQLNHIQICLSQPILNFQDNLHNKKCHTQVVTSLEKIERIDEENKTRSPSQKSIHFEDFVTILTQYSIFIVVFGMLIAGSQYHQHVIIDQIDSFNKIVSYLERLQMSSNFVLTQMTDRLNTAAWKTLYNETNIFGLTDEIAINTQITSNDLPSFFTSFSQNNANILYKNLCLEKDLVNDIAMLQGVECLKIYNGALASGFSIVYENYRDSLDQLKMSSLQTLFELKLSDHSTYPIFIEASFARRIITRLIDALAEEFKTTSQQYSHYLHQQIMKFLTCCYVMLFVMILLVCHGIRKFKKECNLAVNILKTVPKSTLLHIRYTKNMIKTNFLTWLERM